MSNEQVFIEYIQEVGAEGLNTAWVIWMLKIIQAANAAGYQLSPEWVKAKYSFTPSDEPLMIYG